MHEPDPEAEFDMALTEAALARIAALHPKLNAFITVTADRARQAAGMVLLGKLSTHEFARGGPTAAPRVVDVDEGPFRRSHPITGPFNATGHPGLALPCGFGASGLPLGLQLIGRRYAEAMLLCIAQGYEQAAGWVKRRPDLPA